MRSPLETPSGTRPGHTWTSAVTLTLSAVSQGPCSVSLLVIPEGRNPRPSQKAIHLSRIPPVPLISSMLTAPYPGRPAPGSGEP